MKYLITLILVFTSITDPVTRIAKSNALKKEAKEFYDKESYELAISSYASLLDSMMILDEDARLNMANAAYFLAYGNNELLGVLNEASENPDNLDESAVGMASEGLKYASIASSNYDELSGNAKNNVIASSAFNQKGIIAYKRSEAAKTEEKKSLTDQALNDFKNSLRKNPENESARYNYELLRKLIREQEQQEKDNEDSKDQEQKEDQEKKDQEQKDKKDQQEKNDQEKKDQEKQENKDQEKKDQQENNEEQDPNQEKPQEKDPLEKLKEKLEEMNMSPEKAQMILEAMKNNEVQYVQQNKRKATKKKDSSKPDW
ncbi:hypothetical protein [Roseivirga sp.]|uniref:hypothetical protein n=1 Tax=Roseivirga sp. TaxID=1964215 RepID=UPI002B2653F1|nr:hypothetical protein [Roseivirga sp.]